MKQTDNKVITITTLTYDNIRNVMLYNSMLGPPLDSTLREPT